jgi:hypothetical protein
MDGGVQPGLAASDQPDTVAALAEQAGGGPPDARARSGDRNRLCHVSSSAVSRRGYPSAWQGNRR